MLDTTQQPLLSHPTHTSFSKSVWISLWNLSQRLLSWPLFFFSCHLLCSTSSPIKTSFSTWAGERRLGPRWKWLPVHLTLALTLVSTEKLLEFPQSELVVYSRFFFQFWDETSCSFLTKSSWGGWLITGWAEYWDATAAP